MFNETGVRRQDYHEDAFWNRFKSFAKEKETPFLVMRLDRIREKYHELRQLLPEADIYYAVKANPSEKIIGELSTLGSSFDIASIYELDRVLKLGVDPKNVSFGNTIKKERDIVYAYERGIDVFACDSFDDLQKLSRSATGSKVFFRVLFDGGSSADWPLSRKFGADPQKVYSLISKSRDMGLKPFGISFHVGSQQKDKNQWDYAIYMTKELFKKVKKNLGIDLEMMNIGGGFPSKYLTKTPPIDEYTRMVRKSLQRNFGKHIPKVYLEPGRSLVADAGIMVSEVVMVSRKSIDDAVRWVFLDVGKFGGLIETLDESIKYPFYCEAKESDEPGDVILAGPTCDSMDILYENFKIQLPKTLVSGDRLYVFTTGAYTRAYCSIEFNGFPPIPEHYLD